MLAFLEGVQHLGHLVPLPELLALVGKGMSLWPGGGTDLLFVEAPDVFTKTPLEGVIQQRGFGAQSSIAGILRGTPLFVFGGALAWAYHAYRATMAATVEQRPAGAVAYHFAGSTLVMAFGWILLGIDTTEPITVGPLDSPDLDETWVELSGVSSDDAYRALDHPHETLWGFGMVNGAFEEVSALMTGAVGSTGEDDPSVLIRDLVKMQATSLGNNGRGQGVLNTFDSLARNCARSGDLGTYSMGPGAELQNLFDTRVGTIGEDAAGSGVDCATLWLDFEEQTQGLANDSFVNLTTGETGGMFSVLGALGGQRVLNVGMKYWGMSEQETTQLIGNLAVEATLKDAASRSASGMNPLRKDEATFSEGWSDYLVEVLTDGVMTEALLNTGSLIDPNIHLRAQKAEAAKRFNEIADMIPPLRGFLFGAFAATFPLAAYALALGFTGPMQRWLTGRFVLAMYQPAAHLVYGAVQRFARYNDIANNPDYEWLHSETVVLGVLSTIEAETLRVQTAYLLCEVAIFSAFAIGSVRFLGMGGLSAAVGINTWAYSTLGSEVRRQGSRLVASATGRGAVAAGAEAGSAAAAARVGAAAGPQAAAAAAALAVVGQTRLRAPSPPPPSAPPRSFK